MIEANKNCFAIINRNNVYLCSCLKNVYTCRDCKFFKTREDYRLNVAPLKYE